LGEVNFKVRAKKGSWLVRYSVVLDLMLRLSIQNQILLSQQVLSEFARIISGHTIRGR
jgi:hypothetical protein